MCDLQAKLIAWLDQELPTDEAIEVERHIERCKECRGWVATYAHVSRTFDAYCDAVMVLRAPRRAVLWVPVLASALVGAAMMFLTFSRPRVQPPLVENPTVHAASVLYSAPPAAEPARPKTPVHRRHPLPSAQEYARKEQPLAGAVEIAIPAEAMFPPGAMPRGINFIADLRIAPDGSVQQVRLRQ